MCTSTMKRRRKELADPTRLSVPLCIRSGFNRSYVLNSKMPVHSSQEVIEKDKFPLGTIKNSNVPEREVYDGQ